MFTQSIESPDALDASCLIMPLVFFSSPTDPRLTNTLQRILLPPEKGKKKNQESLKFIKYHDI
jgi:GH15 family glucan-1,4-alpha-glucosidase